MSTSKNKQCWICGSEANSGEHKFKASDLKRTYGKRFSNILYNEKETPLTSYKDKNLKFSNVICIECNERKTKQHDNAYDTFIEYTDNNFPILIETQVLDFKKVYGENWKEMKTNLYRYFAKHAGCKLKDSLFEQLRLSDIADFIKEEDFINSFTLQFELKPLIQRLHEFYTEEYKYTHLYNASTIYFRNNSENLSFGGWTSKNWMTTNWIYSLQIDESKQMNFERSEEFLLIKDFESYTKSFNEMSNIKELLEYIEYGELNTLEKQIEHLKKIMNKKATNNGNCCTSH